MGSANAVKDHYNDAALQNIEITANGYLYVYCSNESPVRVFFDNLQVIHTRGPILEETHYYPFGLVQAGISSNALKGNYAENKYKYNGIEQNTDFDLNIGETFFRTHDLQLGRWWQIDPKPTERFSPYAAMNNNPILLSDPMGDTTWVYNQNGTLMGVVPDRMKNQVHFIETEMKGGSGQMSMEGLTKKQINQLGKEFRKKSFAFIGSKTVADMRKIDAQSESKGVEVGFVGTVGEDKEIRLTALPVDERNAKGSSPLEAQINENYPTPEQQSNLFLAGHTHVVGTWTTSDSNPQSVFGFPSPGNAYGGDYNKFLYRNNDGSAKGSSPLLVVTKFGVTVYGSKHDYSNSSYLLYKSLK